MICEDLSAGLRWRRRPCILWHISAWSINSPIFTVRGWRADCFSTFLDVLWGSKTRKFQFPTSSSCTEVMSWCLLSLGGCLMFTAGSLNYQSHFLFLGFLHGNRRAKAHCSREFKCCPTVHIVHMVNTRWMFTWWLKVWFLLGFRSNSCALPSNKTVTCRIAALPGYQTPTTSKQKLIWFCKNTMPLKWIILC